MRVVGILWVSLALGASGGAGEFSLPDPLETLAGEEVTTVAQWNEIRREEILELFRANIYGRAPVGQPDSLRFDVREIDPEAMDGAATLKLVDIRYSGVGGEGVIGLIFFVPNDAPRPVPGFLLICNRNRRNIDPTREERHNLVEYDWDQFMDFADQHWDRHLGAVGQAASPVEPAGF